MQNILLAKPMQNIIWQKYSKNVMQQFLIILTGVVLLAFASQLSVPLIPIPLTFQSSAVVLIGMLYGPRYGTYVVSAYLLAGLCGIPVFEGFAFGPAVFFGATSGYLIGFLPAVWISGYLAQKGWAKNILTSFAAAIIGVSFIFLFGVTVLAQSIGWQHAISFGLLPFIVSEPIKLLVVACLIPRCWKK